MIGNCENDSQGRQVRVLTRASQSSPTLHIAEKKGTAFEMRQARRFQAPRLWGKSSGLLDVGNGSKLRDILLSPEAWDCLTPADKEAILALLPKRYRLYGSPDVEALSNDDNFRNDCAHYYDSIAEGRLTEAWLKRSWRAHLKSKRGDFDKHLRHAFEDQFLANEPGNGDGKKKAAETAEQGDTMDLDHPDPADGDKADGDKAKDDADTGSPTLS
ncbi:hypothetical protein QBC40DRAFT_274307 [Triangularia verruculosa]|uniref:ASX DEUBAD domain-containing protein n=1 Tax=Triangularia verruculosa TaxID=2587418 RepID=A0AAN6XMV3_9PEZI|nr:hypothetical protein QBC40DRAFT_274307 [Triangularia verruculosa]